MPPAIIRPRTRGSPGPPLSVLRSGITREEILSTHLSKKRSIPVGYQAILFTLKSGDTTTGIIDKESPAEITLRTPQGFKTLDKTEIASRKILAPTLKPSELLDAMTKDEVRDLIAWLTTTPSESTDSSEKSTHPIQPPHLEAEDLKAKANGGTLLKRIMTPFGNSHWGGNHILKWSQAEPGYQLRLPFHIKEAGTYRMSGAFVRASHYMITSISLNDEKEPLIPKLDLYHPFVVPTAEIAIFNRYLSAGEHHLTFTIMGANPKKRPGAMIISIDFFTLKKANDPSE